MSELTDDVAAVKADEVALSEQVAKTLAYIKTVPDQITTAVQAAIAAGADPATLQALRDLHATVSADAVNLAAGTPAS